MLLGAVLDCHSSQIIRYALSVNVMDALLRQQLLTTSSHIRETRHCFGMNQIGNRYAKAVMIERRRVKMEASAIDPNTQRKDLEYWALSFLAKVQNLLAVCSWTVGKVYSLG